MTNRLCTSWSLVSYRLNLCTEQVRDPAGNLITVQVLPNEDENDEK